MAAADGSSEHGDDDQPQHRTKRPRRPSKPESTADESEEDESEDEEEEPRLKYATLTRNVSSLYRNGDATSTFHVAGDKMVVGTHAGNIHVFTLPSFSSLRVYHAHTASISAISISPYNPPLAGFRYEQGSKLDAEGAPTADKTPTSSPAPKGKQQQPPVPDIPSNRIYIATSSIDGNVCIASLVDPRDVQLRNFGRPVQTVALSPEYKSDRSYLSGGQAGSLVLTTGGQAGKSANATTTGAAAAATGWLGSIGLGANTGSDKVLHSGEGIISTIKWSLSGKYVLWVNEQGIKIMRSNLKLESGESGQEWKRISHIDRPNRTGWEDMAGVWKARAEWINRDNLEAEDDSNSLIPTAPNGAESKPDADKSKVEDILIGWGDSVWLIKVYPGSGEGGSDNKIGSAKVATIIRFDDCTISGISLYTPNLLLVLAYMQKKGNGAASQESEGGKKSRRARQNALEPELRLIDINTKEEIDTDTLTVSRFETLSASDYHLGILPPVRIPAGLVQTGYLSTIGSGMTTVGSTLVTGVGTVGQGVWDATMYGPRMLGANRIFSGAESVRSAGSGPDRISSAKERNYLTGWIPGFGSNETNAKEEMNTMATAQSMKIFIYSPYDCIVAIRRNLYDRMKWLTSVKKYKEAWELVDQHPEAAGTLSESSESSTPPTPSKASSTARSGSALPSSPTQARQQATLTEFFADSASMTSSAQNKSKAKFSAAEKEKRRIGELWLKQLVDAKKWTEAGDVAAKVLNTTTRWEHWAWVFIKSKKIDEISSHIPTLELTPPLPSSIFEIILGYYVETDRLRFKGLLDEWPSDLFEISSITTAIQDQFRGGGAPSGSQDWRLLQEGLAKLYLADGRYEDALRCYISLQDADTALSLIKDNHLVEAIAEDIPSFVTLRISPSQLKSASQKELAELASDPIRLLVDEVATGVVAPDEIVAQLDKPDLKPFLYFYLRALWRGEGTQEESSLPRVGHSAITTSLAADSGKQYVEEFADTAVDVFAQYDRSLLMEFLQASTAYTFEKAVQICEKGHYVEELVYLLSKTGQTKKALFLIIDELNDVSKAITFAKEQDDQSLWDDFLEYSMSRPRFISGLLAEVGTAIDPITLVKRIPSGLEVEGLKDGLKKMIREYDLQDSISSGVAKVLSSEVAVGMETLRRGRRKGIRFDIVPPIPRIRRPLEMDNDSANEKRTDEQQSDSEVELKPGHCASCHKAFHENETETLVGFACGHIYHVSHLLGGPDAEGIEVLLPRSRDDDDDDAELTRFSRSVGPKVTAARLLKDKIQNAGGCAVCKGSREKMEEVGG
ncbi:Vacuolar protein sorting-associated protein 41 [Cladophialophora chaetospira]|uniref:Vacuolar protein sorting-associated protein 41 n=1 Tax=Cladophialophora chaetospira TaxID=386627 RepID=A0AA38XDH8_9EURO|nr:Vacuolar protein sorting-associated protein 41 [Cladophialophora chaetospira]